MSTVHTANVIPLGSARDRRIARAVDARRHLHAPDERRTRERPEGRAWLNGSELGAARDALGHLAEVYD